MDKLSNKILKYMRTSSENPSEHTYDFSEDTEEVAKNISSDYESVRSSIRYLESSGYIKYVYANSEMIVGYYLDHKGLHQEELDKIEQREFWRKSIWTPILVSLITNALVIGIAALL